MTEARKRAALKAINLIKEKRDDRVKGRTCADGRKQRVYIPKEEASSPTIPQEALNATLAIDAFERRAVAIFDVPGAYLHANMPEDKFAVIKFENEFVDIMCEINKELIEDIKYEKGEKYYI